MTNKFGGYGKSLTGEVDFSKVAKKSELNTKVTSPAIAKADNIVLIKDATGEIKDSGINMSDLITNPPADGTARVVGYTGNLVSIKNQIGSLGDSGVKVDDLLKNPMTDNLDMNNHKITGLTQDYPPRDYTQAASWGDVTSLNRNNVDKAGDRMTGDLIMTNNKIMELNQDYPPTSTSQAICWGQARKLADTRLNRAGDTMSGDLNMNNKKITALNQDYPPNEAGQVICWSQARSLVDTKLSLSGGTLTGNLSMTIGRDDKRSFGCSDLKDATGFHFNLGDLDNRLQYEKSSRGPQPVMLHTTGGFGVKQGEDHICYLGNPWHKNISISREVNMNWNRINKLSEPSDSSDAATKNYVDINAKKEKSVITVWAEEVGGTQPGQWEWSMGDKGSQGAHRHSGYCMPARGNIIRMSLSSVARGGAAGNAMGVGISVNGRKNTSYVVNKEASKKSAYTIFTTPLVVEAGSVINVFSLTPSSDAKNSVVAVLIELEL